MRRLGFTGFRRPFVRPEPAIEAKGNIARTPEESVRPTRFAILHSAPIFHEVQASFDEVMSKSVAELTGGKAQRVPIYAPPVEALLDALSRVAEEKGRVVVLGHSVPPPDGDAVGSAISLVRCLRHLGVDAVACFDVERLKGELRSVVDEGEVIGPEALDQPADMVVLTDVASTDQLGGAARALVDTPEVLVIDHHDRIPNQESLGLTEDQQLLRWIEPSVDSASQMVMSLCHALLEDAPEEALPKILLPALVGLLTDTRFGERQPVSLMTLLAAKHLVEKHFDGDAEAIRAACSYEVPKAVERLLRGEDALNGDRVSIERQKVAGQHVQWMEVPGPILEEALRLTEEADEMAIPEDILGPLLAPTDLAVFRETGPKSPTIAAVYFPIDGGFQVSVRSSDPNSAAAIAQALGGGGKAHLGAARVEGDAAQVKEAFHEAVRDWSKTRLKLRSSR